MKGTNHIATGIISAGLSPFTPAAPLEWAALVIGSVAPDIDAGGGLIAKPSNFLPAAAKNAAPVKLLDGATSALSRLIRRVFGHRNFTHWPVIGLALAVIGWKSGITWLIWFGMGYVVHILGDAITKSGVPLLGPVITKDIRLLPKALCLTTGSFFEGWLLSALLWGYIGVETYKHFLCCH